GGLRARLVVGPRHLGDVRGLVPPPLDDRALSRSVLDRAPGAGRAGRRPRSHRRRGPGEGRDRPRGSDPSGRGGPGGRGVAPRGTRGQPSRASPAARRQRELLGDTVAGAHDPPTGGRARVSDIRITDLAHPELTDEQRAAITRAATIPVTLTEEAVLGAAPRPTRPHHFGRADLPPPPPPARPAGERDRGAN